MTREQAKELLPVIQAFAEGKAIQFALINGTLWKDLDHEYPKFESDSVRWRLKPEPRRFWLIKRKGDGPDFITVSIKEPTTSDPSLHDHYEVIPVIEVPK